MKHIIIISIGIVFIVLGFIGLFLPILQGILFLLIGLFLLAPYSPFLRSQLDKLKRKYPGAYAYATRLRERFSKRSKKNDIRSRQ